LETPSTISVPLERDSDEGIEPRGAAQPIVAVIVTTAVPYFARDIFIPSAVASFLSIIFSPIPTRLERFVGLFASCFLVVVTAIVAIAGLAYFLTTEIASVAVQITDYTDNISAKITALKGSTPEWLQRIEDGVTDVDRRVQKHEREARSTIPSIVVQAPATESGIEQVIRPTLPLLRDMIEMLFIIIFFFFLLYGRKELRDRLVRLTARCASRSRQKELRPQLTRLVITYFCSS
jgi:predicted PurR-regulated permease PerM